MNYRVRSSILVLAAMLGCASCKPQKPNDGTEAKPAGKFQETWDYWNAFNKIAVSGSGVEVFRQKAWSGPGLNNADISAVLHDVAAGELANCQMIEKLPVLNVEPALTAYAVDSVKLRTGAANFMNDLADYMEHQSQATSGVNLGLGFADKLLKHRNDEEGMFWNSLMDETADVSSTVQQSQEAEQALAERAARLKSSGSNLRVEEMSVRSLLAQKYNREFPPLAVFRDSAPSSKDAPLTESQIMGTLVGQKIQQGGGAWTFASTNEFISVRILNCSKSSDVLTDYDVQTHVKGRFSGTEHDFRLRLTFGKIYTRQKLVQIQPLQP